MKTQIAFCSACDRDVRIVLPETPVDDAQAPVANTEIVCLEVGERCTGSLCPVGAVSPTAMMVRRVRSGVHPVLEPIVKVECPSCARVTDYAIISPDYATCIDCGTTVPRDDLDLALGRDG